MYSELKKQNSEAFAQAVRKHHNGILELDFLLDIVRHAGRDAAPLLPYLMGLLLAKDSEPKVKIQPRDPFVLLEQAGYDAFHADTHALQNDPTFMSYFEQDEKLCTFRSDSRFKNYHIIHAIKKGADKIKRDDYRGKEERQDDYGTSVISIQMLKTGGFISIKNRYNHTVSGCDNTFNSNPNNIIDGLTAALKDHFDVDFFVSKNPLPDGYVLMGKQILQYYAERNNIYYGDQAYAKDGEIHALNRCCETMFDGYIFDHKTKTMRNIDPLSIDSFPKDFNRAYGGNKKFFVKNSNLMMDGEVLIGAEQSRITTINLAELTTTGDGFMCNAKALTSANLPALTTVGNNFMPNAKALTSANLPALTTTGDGFMRDAKALTSANLPALTTTGDGFMRDAKALTSANLPALTAAGDRFMGPVRLKI